MMILELFILLEVVMLTTFFISFFTKQEILWAIAAVLSGALMVASYNVQITTHVLDSARDIYVPTLTSFSFPFMMGINFLFFILAVILGLLDLFDKYGISTLDFKKKCK